LAAIWDDDAARGEAAAKQFGTRFVSNQEAFLKDGLDAVIITSENIKHRAMVEAAAKAGLWILCEKPLATTIEDAQAMVSACKAAGVGLGTAFPCRYIPAIVDVKRRIDAGELGTVYAVSCTNNGRFPGGWFADPALAGGGATMDHTVHVADVLRWLLGKEFTKVYCENGNLLREGIATDDVGSVHLEMEGGVIISHVASWNRAQSFPTWGDVTLELIGEKSVIQVDAFNQKIDVYDDTAMTAEWAYWGDSPDLGLVRDFVESVVEKRDPAVTGIDGLRAVEVTVAAYESAREKRMVAIR
jgi:predicted dehydrogenase